MKDLIQYKGYYGSVQFIRALVSYEATDAKGLKRVYQEAVDDYLQTSVFKNA
jgi:hypothetical protein